MAIAVVALVPACGGDDVDGAPAALAACDDLRARQGELIDIANEVLGRLADAEDDRTRYEAVASGYDRLVAAAEAQEVGEVEPEVRDALVAGAAAAVDELADERRRHQEAHAGGVSAEDERGVAGGLQNALEKAFSELEVPRAAYRQAGLATATDEDPDCRFVTQRGDPAG